MSYKVKETFYSIQGEGARAGRPAVFCRFSGCNLWSGREEDRASSICRVCDTDFIGTDGEGGGSFATAEMLTSHLLRLWPDVKGGQPYLIFTGGEPTLQLDQELIAATKQAGFELAIESNGTHPIPPGLDWVTISPKPEATQVVMSGNELKLLYPSTLAPEAVAHLDFDHFFLQPIDNKRTRANRLAALAYCLTHPQWRLSLQIHKFIGVK